MSGSGSASQPEAAKGPAEKMPAATPAAAAAEALKTPGKPPVQPYREVAGMQLPFLEAMQQGLVPEEPHGVAGVAPRAW